MSKYIPDFLRPWRRTPRDRRRRAWTCRCRGTCRRRWHLVPDHPRWSIFCRSERSVSPRFPRWPSSVVVHNETETKSFNTNSQSIKYFRLTWPQPRLWTWGSSKPGTEVDPDCRWRAVVNTFWVISVGTGIPALVTKAPKSRPIVPSSSTRTLPSSATLPSSPCTSYCRRLFGSGNGSHL